MDSDRLFSGKFAYDAAKEILSKGEVFNDNAIDASIDNILSTIYTERLFKPGFGSRMQLLLFENITSKKQLILIMEMVIESIEKWENKIKIIKEFCSIDFDSTNQLLDIEIGYMILRSGIKSSYQSTIRIG